jgi:hypothetical protein
VSHIYATRAVSRKYGPPPPTQFLQAPHSSRSSIMALIRISVIWCGIGIADFEKRPLERLWNQLGKKQQVEAMPVTIPTSTPTRVYNKIRT